MTDAAELAEQLQPLAELARAHGLDEIVLREPATLSWLFGARWNVPHTLDSACFDVVLELSAAPVVRIVTNAIEAPRLADTDQAAALLAGELLDRGIEPVCLFVAGGERMGRHRHPLPTSGALGARASLVCCARRHGLIASVTRIVCFGSPGAASLERYRRLLDVEAAFLDATEPGARLGDVVQAGVEAYAANGFDPQEWTRHHQGGLTGWLPREFPAHPGTDLIIPLHSAVAWNPSADTWKVEDTCVIRTDGVQPLGHDVDWPSVVVSGRARPDLLVA
ncbi:MAG: M24 family metallopeptidase [Jatrophihabitans sp.]